MCDSPILVPNKKRWLNVAAHDPLYYRVPCGKCESCVKLKRSEWLFRITKEFEACVRSGGHVIFDTLTYNNDSVHYLHEYFQPAKYMADDCFVHCYEDVQLFLKRMRKKLSFRYIVVGEFGDDPRYSQRPHWHCLFFLPASVDCLEFSQLVSSEWYYGFHDGINKGYSYFVTKRVFDAKSQHSNNVINYVSKYITKSFFSDKRLKAKIKRCFQIAYGDHWYDSYNHLMEYNKVYRLASPNHYQSLGFGSLSVDDVNEFISNGFCRVATSDGYVKVPFYRSLRRKYLFDVVNRDGYKCWHLNNVGLDYQHRFFAKTIDNERNRLQGLVLSGCASDVVSNMDAYRSLHRYDLSILGIDELFNVSSFADKIVNGLNGLCTSEYPTCQNSSDLARYHKRLFPNKKRPPLIPYDFYSHWCFGDNELLRYCDDIDVELGYLRILEYHEKLRKRHRAKQLGLYTNTI